MITRECQGGGDVERSGVAGGGGPGEETTQLAANGGGWVVVQLAARRSAPGGLPANFAERLRLVTHERSR